MTANKLTKVQACPLCETETEKQFFRDKKRDYFRCPMCSLIFVSPEQFLSEGEEKERYDLHQNSPEDQRYRQFLGRLFNPMLERLAPGSCGLDFGSGPGPTLSKMFEEAGHVVSIYDYYYANNPAVLEKQYDFITASEVLEHLFHPRKEFDRLWSCLKLGGNLGIMTQFAPNQKVFENWYYKNDLTHICFYAKETFRWIAEKWNAELSLIDNSVAIFSRNN